MGTVDRSANAFALRAGAFALLMGVLTAATVTAQQPCRAGHVHQGRRADLPEVLPELPPARVDRADVAAHLRRRAAVGALDQAACRGAADAAVARRPHRRHPEVQGRSVADRSRKSRRSSAWADCRRAARQPSRHAAAAPVRRRRSLAHRQAGSRSCRCPKVFTVKTEAADWWGIFEADSGLTEDRYIKAVEAKPSPGARRVVHHVGRDAGLRRWHERRRDARSSTRSARTATCFPKARAS